MSTRAKASSSKDSANASTGALSADQLRRKAKFQLLGSAVLVALGVVLFAVLLDSPPRPNTNEVSILIPARDSLAPLAFPGTASTSAQVPAATAPAVLAPSAAASSATAPVVAAPTAKAPASAPVPTAAANTQPAAIAATPPASSVKPASPSVKATDTTTPANAASAPAGAARYVVQVGAFTDPQKIRDVRAKLERAGFKTYAQVIQSTEGQRTRVRVGPFATKLEAEKAAAKIKSLDLPAALLTL